MLDESNLELVVPASGEGTIYRDNHGECVKKLQIWYADRVKDSHDAYKNLVAAHIPTFDRYEPDYDAQVIRMDDISENGRNLVVSKTDFRKFARQPDGSWSPTKDEDINSMSRLWTESARNKLVQNADQFIVEFAHLVDNIIAHKFRLLFSTYFLVASPNGVLKTIIGDMGDVAMGSNALVERGDFRPHEFQMYIAHAAHYLLNVVAPFFPTMIPPIHTLLETFEQKYGVNLTTEKTDLLQKKFDFVSTP